MTTRRLGVDLGGTWLRACSGDKRRQLPAVPWREAPAVLRKLGRFDELVIGAKGIWTPADRAEARRLLKSVAPRVVALSDLELAHAGAFAGGPGVLLIAGTGSGAYAVDERGRVKRAGGWGPLIGDDGSAFWLGREALRDPALRRRLKLDPLRFRGPDTLRKVAALAPRVLAVSPRLRREAAAILAGLAREAGSGLPVSWTGGLLHDAGLRKELERRVKLRPPLMPPECAAFLWRA